MARLPEEQIRALLESSDDEDGFDFSDSGSEYVPSDKEIDLDDSKSENADHFSSGSSFILDLMDDGDDNIENISPNCLDIVPPFISAQSQDAWKDDFQNFRPRKTIPTKNCPSILVSLDRSSTEIEIFLKLFPRSLFMMISDCTNKRLNMLPNAEKIPKTDYHEIMIVLGITLIMTYNRLPNYQSYWSKKKSQGNSLIKSSISRDRYCLLSSKLYFNDPQKPEDCSKTYYIDEVVACLKHTYLKCREESSHQSIDESMAKFKGRSAMKQYLPMKPIKRGIKIWERCDSITGYTYDLNIYSGKENINQDGTLGERVINKLVSSVRISDVSFCFDRFFSTVNLINSISYPVVGTIMSNRKNVPKFNEKLKRGESKIFYNQFGTTISFWQDTKQVIVASNCHYNDITEVQRKVKTGEKFSISCPKSIEYYVNFMGGVDLSDQMAAVYDVNRKSAKWWKKVFYKLLMTTCVNAWIIRKELHHKKFNYLDFLSELAEALVTLGRENATHKRSHQTGRTAKKPKIFYNVGDHMPIEGTARRRCVKCAKDNSGKKDKRTYYICQACDIPLCFQCFTPYHK